MIIGIIGRKLGMTQIFDVLGKLVPVTVIEAGPCHVTQIKSTKHDGYEGVQIAFQAIPERKVTRPVKGHLAKAGVSPMRFIREIPANGVDDVVLGHVVKADVFKPGDKVKVTGTSKGKGFAGVVKRYHFRGGDATHGSTVHRKPQSGGGTDAARTFKGSRRPGHMGAERVTQRGLSVYRVEPGANLILIKGAVPGATGGLVMIVRQSVGG
jgi:large subunit ribosomal protein L3